MCGGMGAPPLSRLRPLWGLYKYEMSRCVPGVPRPLRCLLPLTWRNPIRILYEHRTNPTPIGERDRVSGQILVARGKETVGLAVPGRRGIHSFPHGSVGAEQRFSHAVAVGIHLPIHYPTHRRPAASSCGATEIVARCATLPLTGRNPIQTPYESHTDTSSYRLTISQSYREDFLGLYRGPKRPVPKLFSRYGSLLYGVQGTPYTST